MVTRLASDSAPGFDPGFDPFPDVRDRECIFYIKHAPRDTEVSS